MRNFIVLYEFEGDGGAVIEEMMFAVKTDSVDKAAILPLEVLGLSEEGWHVKVYEIDEESFETYKLVLSDYVKNLERGE